MNAPFNLAELAECLRPLSWDERVALHSSDRRKAEDEEARFDEAPRRGVA
jgi:hypothetical protein